MNIVSRKIYTLSTLAEITGRECSPVAIRIFVGAARALRSSAVQDVATIGCGRDLLLPPPPKIE